MTSKKVILIVRDGWGESNEIKGNAIRAAKVVNHNKYINEFPTALLKCTGNEVGNPTSAQGGSEVGHLTLGAGRIVWQPQELINQSIINGSFFENQALLSAISHSLKNGSNLHLSGLLSDAGVHSDINHLYTLLDLAKINGLKNVYIHLVLDGRDVPEKSALSYLEKLENKIKEIGVGKIASVEGRFYAMDRDTNWDRTRAAYELMTQGKGFMANSAKEAIESAYARGDKTDYYIQPTVILENGTPITLVKNEDSFVWFNFRSDRSRQITALFTKETLCPIEFQGEVLPFWVCMCRYDEAWDLPVAFEPEKVINNLGQVLAQNEKKQLRVAETEKYAHVTFFFNSQIETPNVGEDRILVPSPKVASYDLQPEMSAPEVCQQVLDEIGNYDFILVNFANADLVGHSGIFDAVVKACEVVDDCVGKIVNKAMENNYYVVLGADHGNAEQMLYANNETNPSHGFNPVTYTIIGDNLENIKLKSGGLKDVAPTILDLMGIEKPLEMTGESLLIS